MRSEIPRTQDRQTPEVWPSHVAWIAFAPAEPGAIDKREISETISEGPEFVFLGNHKEARRLGTHLTHGVADLTRDIGLPIGTAFLVERGVEGIEMTGKDRGPVVDLEVRSDPRTLRKMPYRSTAQMLIDDGAKSTTVDHCWPTFDAGTQVDDVYSLLLLVVPEYFLYGASVTRIERPEAHGAPSAGIRAVIRSAVRMCQRSQPFLHTARAWLGKR